MALATYNDLVASVAAWTHRSDLAALIPDFIVLAEKRINGDLDARLQDTVTTLNVAAGAPSVAIPADVINIRSLTLQSSPNVVLDYLTPDQFNTQYAAGQAGAPQAFSVIGTSIYLGPLPDAAYGIQCVYKAAVPALATAAGGANWLMTNYPHVYLTGALIQAAKFLVRPADQIQQLEANYAEAIKSVNATDWYSGSTMRVRHDMRM